MGVTLGEIIFDVGAAYPRARNSRPCRRAVRWRLSARFGAQHAGGLHSLTAAGATMGSGGMIVVDEDTCMVEFAKYFLTFATAESCGKCVPCRIGGQRLLEVLTRVTDGRAPRPTWTRSVTSRPT